MTNALMFNSTLWGTGQSAVSPIDTLLRFSSNLYSGSSVSAQQKLGTRRKTKEAPTSHITYTVQALSCSKP